MMRRIDLLPAAYVARKRERRTIALTLMGGMLVLLLLFGWWVFIRMSISDEKSRLEAAETQNSQLQAQIDELQEYALLQAEVEAKRFALTRVMTGDIRWPAILTEIAMAVPNEVQLQSINGSTVTAEGGAPVGTETAAVRIDPATPQGRLQFTGESRTMPGVARWLSRLGTVEAFTATWLNSATGNMEGEQLTSVTFDSTLELGEPALSNRFQGGQQQ